MLNQMIVFQVNDFKDILHSEMPLHIFHIVLSGEYGDNLVSIP